MTSARARSRSGAQPAVRPGGGLRTFAFVLVSACLAGRAFLGEMPFRVSQLKIAPGAAAAGQAHPGPATHPAGAGDGPVLDRTEAARVTFAVLLLAAWALWLVGEAVGGRLILRTPLAACALLAFAGVSFASALGADDRRCALIFWLEQVSLLASGVLAVQLFAERRRWWALLIVLAALGATLSAKGIYQELVERPDRIADFDAHRAERLAELGLKEGTTQARMMEARLRSRGALGYFGLANPFASLVVVLLGAAAGVAAAKALRARRLRRRDRPSMKPSEVHLPTLAAVVTWLAVAAVALCVVLTRSRGATAAALAAALAAAAAMRFRRRLAPHWRRALLAAAGLLLVGGGAVAACGLLRGRLPTRTMAFRWLYWTGTAGVIAERPVLGVGPGNFPQAYLRHRPTGTDEAIKNPHNVVLHALAQYGVVGGVCFLAVAGALLAGACRPRQDAGEGEPPREAPWLGRPELMAMAAAVLAAPAARALVAGEAHNVVLLVLNAIVPAALLAGMLVVFAWVGRRLSAEVGDPGWARAALAAGCAAFALHNLVTFSAWMPGAAGAFWVGVGACAARGFGGRGRDLSVLRWPLAAAGGAAVVAAAVLLWRPTITTSRYTDAMVRAAHAGRLNAALRSAECAAEADPLDPIPAADAARLSLAVCPIDPPAEMRVALRRAHKWARAAWRRSPERSSYARQSAWAAWFLADTDYFAYARAWADLPAEDRLAQLRRELARRPSPVLHARIGDAQWQLGLRREARRSWRRAAALAPGGPHADEALAAFAAAVKLNPADVRLRVEHARLLCAAGRGGQALAALAEADRLDDALPAGSVERLRGEERSGMRRLRERARTIAAPPKARPTPMPTGEEP